MASEDYNFYILVANALSAAGTFFASAVALYIAVRQTKLKQKDMVNIEVEIVKQVDIGDVKSLLGIKHCKSELQELNLENYFLKISVYNIGFKDISVKAIALESKEYFEAHFWTGKAFNQPYDNIKIKSGDMLYRIKPITSIIHSQEIMSLYKKMKKPQRNLYINVNTEMGHVFRQKLPKEFHQLMASKISRETK